MPFADVYPYYIEKAEKKGRTKQEVDTIICWLTGYSQDDLDEKIRQRVDFESFFEQATLNPKRSSIT